jgi:hypothetical protein
MKLRSYNLANVGVDFVMCLGMRKQERHVYVGYHFGAIPVLEMGPTFVTVLGLGCLCPHLGTVIFSLPRDHFQTFLFDVEIGTYLIWGQKHPSSKTGSNWDRTIQYLTFRCRQERNKMA